MDNNGRPDNLEDFLCSHRTGQWFGFENLNGDDANKTYVNLIIHDGSEKPTEQECTDGLTQLQADFDAKEYARNRQAEYPSIQECVHAILDDDLDNLQVLRQAVKDKFPKT